MQGQERRMFAERLGALADAMGGKLPATEKGMQIWLDAIDDLPGWAVLQAVNNWMKHSSRFPTAYDLRKAAVDAIETEQERTAQRNTDDAPELGQVVASDPKRAEQFERFIQAFRATIPHDNKKLHLYWNTIQWSKGRLSLFGTQKLREFYHREPNEQDVEVARQKLREANKLVSCRPHPGDFFK